MVGSSQGSRWWLYVLLTVALVAVIAPFVWMVLGAFKGEGEPAPGPADVAARERLARQLHAPVQQA